jgi:hypothetical protein
MSLESILDKSLLAQELKEIYSRYFFNVKLVSILNEF